VLFRSLERAKVYAAEYGNPVHTKSSLMVGLGENRDELTEAFEALREVDTDVLTIGQYLRPSLQHLAVERYYHPDEFAEMKVAALALGFKHVESGPRVRSSYHARDQVPAADLKAPRRRQATLDAGGRIIPWRDRRPAGGTVTREHRLRSVPLRPNRRVDPIVVGVVVVAGAGGACSPWETHRAVAHPVGRAGGASPPAARPCLAARAPAAPLQPPSSRPEVTPGPRSPAVARPG
jgi:hypothetical protein